MKSCSKWLHGYAAVASLLLAPIPAGAQQTDAFVVDLSRGVVRGGLPFDEAFLLVGPAPTELQRVEPFRKEILRHQPARCPQTTAGLENAGVTWERVRKDPANTAAFPIRPVAADSFVLRMNELRPDRKYVFCLRFFSYLPDTTITRIRAETGKAVARAIQAVADKDPPGDVTKEEIDALITQLHDLLPKPAANQTLHIAAGSLFSPDASSAARKTLEDFVKLQGAALNLAGTRSALDSAAATMTAKLDTFAGRRGALLAQVARSIEAPDTLFLGGSANTNAALSTIRAIITPSPGLFRLVSEGAAILGDSIWVIPGSAPRLTRLWSAEQAVSRVTMLEQTRSRLERLRTLLTVVSTRPGWQVRSGIDSLTMASLRGELDRLRGNFLSVSDAAVRLSSATKDRDAAVLKGLSAVTIGEQDQLLLLGSTVELAVDTRSRRYITPSLGVAYAWDLGTAVPLVGFTFFPGGVNKRVPQHLGDPLRSRIGVQIGLTTSSVAKKDERENLFGNSALAAGVTWRFLDVFHASAGGLVLRQLDPTSLSDESEVRVTPYGALSFDLDVQAIFAGIAKLLGGG